VYRKQVRRRRAVLALLVISSFALLTFTYGQSSGGVQRGVSAVFSPVQGIADRALKPARDLVNWFDQTFDARGENSRLKTQLDELRRKVVAGEAASAENAQLRKLVNLPVSSGYHRVAGRVIARSPTIWYATVTVDVGSDDGVHVNDPVVDGDGLVGRVRSVSGGSSQVTLITDHTSAVSAEVVPEGVQGVVKPDVGNPEELILDFIDSSTRVHRGETVVTAGWRSQGLASIFPHGIPVGTVTDASILAQEAQQQVKLRPFADFRNLDLIAVLTGGGRG
jgi:rod shape-determining protein MreC